MKYLLEAILKFFINKCNQKNLYLFLRNYKRYLSLITIVQVSMMCDHFDQTPEWTFILDNANLFFIVVFTSEMCMKIFALRKFYFLEPWNVFDFIVVMLSLASLFLSDLIEKYFVSPTLLRVVIVYKYFFKNLFTDIQNWNILYIFLYYVSVTCSSDRKKNSFSIVVSLITVHLKSI